MKCWLSPVTDPRTVPTSEAFVDEIQENDCYEYMCTKNWGGTGEMMFLDNRHYSKSRTSLNKFFRTAGGLLNQIDLL